MTQFIAKDPFSGSANQPVKCSAVMNSLVITNDDTTAVLTFTVNGKTWTVRPQFTFDEQLDPFDTFTVNATGNYFGYCRRRTDETR